VVPKYSNEFDEFASNYYLSLKHPIRVLVSKNNDDYFIRVKADIINEIIESAFNGNESITVIDIGAGIGLFEKFIGGRRTKLYGIDLSYKMIHVANYINLNEVKQFCQDEAEILPLNEK